jgi:hypothetical protein
MAGQVAWYNEVGNSSAKQNILGCGQRAPETAARFVPLGPGRYIQLYKLSSYEKLAGNFYELLPNGTSKLIGAFVLNRVDKF